jgi:hypothetical protein
MSWKGWIGPALMVVVLGGVAAVIAMPTTNKWSGAVALKICRDGTPILRLTNGEVWALVLPLASDQSQKNLVRKALTVANAETNSGGRACWVR